MASDYVSRVLRQFMGRSHNWEKAQTFLNNDGKKVCNEVTITVGTEAANVINVAIQLKAQDGTDIAHRAALKMYLSSDANGDTIETSGPDSWAIGTDGILLPDGGDSLISGVIISESDGDIDINMTHSGADTFYLNVVTPDGTIHTSGAITFDATT